MFYESVRLYDTRSRSLIGATTTTTLITESRIFYVETTSIREAFSCLAQYSGLSVLRLPSLGLLFGVWAVQKGDAAVLSASGR